MNTLETKYKGKTVKVDHRGSSVGVGDNGRNCEPKRGECRGSHNQGHDEGRQRGGRDRDVVGSDAKDEAHEYQEKRYPNGVDDPSSEERPRGIGVPRILLRKPVSRENVIAVARLV